MDLSAPQVADILYSRYRVARVMSVITVGSAYQADAIDRRGYRVRFIVDGDSGAVLDSFIIGSVPYEAAVPVPPGLVPNAPGARVPLAPIPGDRLAPSATPKAQPRTRQVRTPDTRTRTDEPAKAAPELTRPDAATPEQAAKPAPGIRSPSSPGAQGLAPPATASRPTEPTEDAPQKPAATLPSPAEPTVGAPAAKPAEAREAAHKARTPEPLIDPKTGQATSVPVAPLDDGRPGNVAKPITIVPPAPLD